MPAKGQKHSDEAKAKIRASMLGKTMSDEAKAKIRAARLGKPAHNRGKPMSDETKAKIANAGSGTGHPQYGRPKSPVQKARNRLSHLGFQKPHPPHRIAMALEWMANQSKVDKNICKHNRMTRLQVFTHVGERDGYVCRRCAENQGPAIAERLTVSTCHFDHVWPAAKARQRGWVINDLNNVELLCPDCNMQKGATSHGLETVDTDAPVEEQIEELTRLLIPEPPALPGPSATLALTSQPHQ